MDKILINNKFKEEIENSKQAKIRSDVGIFQPMEIPQDLLRILSSNRDTEN